jgi:hypothetical protein
MSTVSADSRRGWEVSLDDRATALEIALLKRRYVLPWHQFLYAEGGDDEVRAVFAMHEVIVRGAGLGVLLADLASQNVTVIREPTRADRFQSSSEQFIREVVVQKVEAA